jgi:hypothetical protein
MITAEQFGEAVTEVMRDYLEGSYTEGNIDYSVDHDGDAVYVLTFEGGGHQRFKVTFNVEEVH